MKFLFWLGIIFIVVGTVGAQQAQAPLTFPDVDTPAAAQGVALDAWKNTVQGDLNDHELRLRKLEALLAAQPAPPPTSVIIPITAFLPNSTPTPQITTTSAGTTLWNTVSGQIISYPVSALAPGNYTLTVPVQASGSGNLITVRVNGGTDSMPLTVNPPSASFPIIWPGSSGTLQIVVKNQWVNLYGPLTIQ